MAALSALDWLIRAFSFFNCILSLWLGLTVLLNAERRTWGTWVAGGGLVANGVFFTVHSGIVGRDMSVLGAELAIWWPVVLLPFVGLPYLWYLVMAWYAGQLKAEGGRFALGIASAAGLVVLLLIGIKLLLAADVDAQASGPIMFGPLPASALIFPLYSMLCIGLALDALRRPSAPRRFMGDAARDRARPWLVATSLILLAISIIAGSALVWLLNGLGLRQIELLSLTTLATLKVLDVVVSALVALALIFVGQAAVSYEVFTGRVLPRRGLYRQWRQALVAATIFATLVAASLGLPIEPLYALLVAMLLLTLVLAVQGRRAYYEHQQTTGMLRALVESDHVYQWVTRAQVTGESLPDAFTVLCRDVVGAEVGYLVPMGSIASLAGATSSYPASAHEAPALDGITAALQGGKSFCIPLEPRRNAGARWAVPLGQDGALTGVLLLGRKLDGSLYTAEEIAVARATGERIVEARAGAELARRLIQIQRGRVAESQVADRQTRRLLHDEVLPRLHTAILTTTDQATSRDLAELHRLISDGLHSLHPWLSGRAARDGLIPALRHLVEVEMAGSFERASVCVEPGADDAAATVPELSREVAYGAVREIIRNAARYGRGDTPDRPLCLDLSVAQAGSLRVTVADDGVGFSPVPFDGAEPGNGLVLHATMMAVVGGSLEVESSPDDGTRVVIAVPVSPG